MSDQLAMPDMPPEQPKPEPLSADMRRTQHRNELLAAGYHPTTRLPLTDNGETCGTCAHHFVHRRGGTYHKCDMAPGGPTRGPATDVRVSWPACQIWEADQ